ncbi:hypothetical protein R3W88_008934 [Solanum pinnatisectum]|uniref:Uncharacterized protein n=1 Tax=Solanum pinnatisectum TaxID=50273 RepID=A0AAV9MAC8_9SOLN|nr:hypothetical protein R3W88_008934 [Solanum pinnatisectum]
MGFYSWIRPIAWSLIEKVTMEALVLYLAQSKCEKDQGSPFPRYTSLLPNFILFGCLIFPIGVLEPFLLFLNPVKASAKVFIVFCYILKSWNVNLKKYFQLYHLDSVILFEEDVI